MHDGLNGAVGDLWVKSHQQTCSEVDRRETSGMNTLAVQILSEGKDLVRS